MQLRLNYYQDYFQFYEKYRHAGYLAMHENDFRHSLMTFLHDQYKVDIHKAAAVAHALFGSMSNPNLFYHAPIHPLSAFSWAEQNDIVLKPWEQLAFWFHDAIYDPKAKAHQNEEDSLMLFEALLGQLSGNSDFNLACEGIDATGYHLGDEWYTFTDSSLLLDLDLCSFAWDEKNFLAAGNAIALEYGSIYSKEQYTEGRRNFLVALTKRKFLYRTELFRERFEKIAQNNIAKFLSTFK